MDAAKLSYLLGRSYVKWELLLLDVGGGGDPNTTTCVSIDETISVARTTKMEDELCDVKWQDASDDLSLCGHSFGRMDRTRRKLVLTKDQ